MKEVPQIGDLVRVTYYGVVTEVYEGGEDSSFFVNGEPAEHFVKETSKIEFLNDESALARSFDRRSHP